MSKKYDTFAAYLEDMYYNQIFSKINLYIFGNRGHIDLSTSVVPNLSYVELRDCTNRGKSPAHSFRSC